MILELEKMNNQKQQLIKGEHFMNQEKRNHGAVNDFIDFLNIISPKPVNNKKDINLSESLDLAKLSETLIKIVEFQDKELDWISKIFQILYTLPIGKLTK